MEEVQLESGDLDEAEIVDDSNNEATEEKIEEEESNSSEIPQSSNEETGDSTGKLKF